MTTPKRFIVQRTGDGVSGYAVLDRMSMWPWNKLSGVSKERAKKESLRLNRAGWKLSTMDRLLYSDADVSHIKIAAAAEDKEAALERRILNRAKPKANAQHKKSVVRKNRTTAKAKPAAAAKHKKKNGTKTAFMRH